MRKSHGINQLWEVRIWAQISPNISAIDPVYCVTYSMYRTVCGTQDMDPNLFDSLRLELRRGCLTLAVLAQLKSEHYGYTLRKALADLGLEIDEGTLYPLLRRLETQELLTSEWREEGGRRKRFYRLSPGGRQIFKQLLAEWKQMNDSLDRIV
jgi:PadR family transcriptional regulator PadR